MNSVDWSERREDSYGRKGQWETPQALAPRRLPGRPWKAKRLKRKSTNFFNSLLLRNLFEKKGNDNETKSESFHI
ncbi:hypothetical protein AM500_19285 [Bacillus sp. FJAT-18017]|nr:hypothetical protein AM500_19285 [Bacillus sp. FJAT-18017]